MTEHLTGLIAAPHTPFHSTGILNLDVIEQQADWFEAQGISGAFVCGTTGEGISLTTTERKLVAERWVRAAGKRLRVIVHVGHASVAEACELALHARDLNPFAIAAMPPSFFRPATVDLLIDTCAMIAKAAGPTPFYYYHIPSMTGVSLPMPAFLRAGAERIPTLQGIKFTHNDLLEYRQCLTVANGRFDIPFGRDEILLAGLALGAKSAVGSTYNYAAPHYLHMIKAFRAGDLATARAAMDAVVPLIDLLREVGEIAAAKRIMTALGVPCGDPRLPMKALSPMHSRLVEQFVASWNGFQRAEKAPIARA